MRHVHRGTHLVKAERLERRVLGGHQVGARKVPLRLAPCPHALGDDRLRAREVDHHDRTRRLAESVPIRTLERGARDHAVRVGRHPRAHGVEPRPPVVVRQRHAGRHRGDVRLGMEVVCVGKGPSESCGNPRTHRRLAASCDTHDDHAHAARVGPTRPNCTVRGTVQGMPTPPPATLVGTPEVDRSYVMRGVTPHPYG